MSYGVNTWVGQRGRARAAGSSKRKSTRTAKRKTSGSARRAKSSSRKSRASKLTLAQRRRLQRLAPWQQKIFWQDYETPGNPYYSGKVEASLARAENLY
jgi:hypothetical protein